MPVPEKDQVGDGVFTGRHEPRPWRRSTDTVCDHCLDQAGSARPGGEDRGRLELPGLYPGPAGAAPALPRSTYVKLLRDRSVPPAQQHTMISWLGRPREQEIDAGHMATLSAPAEPKAVGVLSLERLRHLAQRTARQAE